jgi:hypothetical protein
VPAQRKRLRGILIYSIQREMLFALYRWFVDLVSFDLDVPFPLFVEEENVCRKE